MMLDPKGIYLDEVNKRYPTASQPLGYDVLLDLDSAYKPKVIPTFELVVNSVIALLVMKPGQYPSIPDLGIDIEQYLLDFSDDVNIPLKIQSQLEDQCNRLGWTGILIDVGFDKSITNLDMLVVRIDGTEYITQGVETPHVIIGITYDKLKRLSIKKTYT